MTATEADARAPGTEIDLHRPQAQPSAIPAKIAYARALAESGLLPDSYRRQPANILWAVEYGEMLGLSTMAAITGVHVIKGKPTASAGLISALVRRAGHKLRIRGDAQSATCQIIRSDDPKYTFEVTFTLDDAKTAELLDKDNWKHFGPSMLKARAITQCARDACEEALFGLHYTPEELGANVDEDGVVVDDPPQQLAERSGGTPEDDQWYVRPEPGPDGDQPENGQRWADHAITLAAGFKSEAEGQKLWRESAAAVIDGRATPGEATHIQNIITARVADRRKEASELLLRHLSEDDDWRDQVRGLTTDDDAREAVAELGRLKGSGTMNETRAGRIAAAIIARYPKAAIQAGDSDG
ncbi:MAG TPA: hypothetical protein VGI96_31680 [Streptosporangiaceae bacterium]|jgi:hypothetical protein